jgi:hypothetical protein
VAVANVDSFVIMKKAAYWVVTLCGSCKNWKNVSSPSSGYKKSAIEEMLYQLAIRLNHSGGDTFLQNIGSYKTHMTPHPR